MTLGRIMLAIAAFGAPPALAQDNQAATQQQPTTTTPPAETVGPRELRDFSLDGTVTRRAEPVTPPAAAPATQRPSAPARGRPAARPATDTQPAPETPQRMRSDAPQERAIDQRDAAAEQPAMAQGAPVATPEARNSLPITTIVQPNPIAQSRSPAWWPWLLALVAAAGAGLWLWRRRRVAPELAYVGVAAAPPAAPPEPTPAPSPPPAVPGVAADDGFVTVRAPSAARVDNPAPASPPPAPAPMPDAIVSTRLAPKLKLDLKPVRADVDADGNAALLYELVVTNSGSAPAREVLIEARLVNAGPDQDQQVAAFFQNPIGRGERIALIPPMQKVVVRGRVTAASGDYRPLELEGRRLLVPLLAFNALYRGSGGDRQDSASFLVGRGGAEGGKMAPMPIDGAAHSWAGLSARTHSMGLQR